MPTCQSVPLEEETSLRMRPKAINLEYDANDCISGRLGSSSQKKLY
jgi:hypothetical protein